MLLSESQCKVLTIELCMDKNVISKQDKFQRINARRYNSRPVLVQVAAMVEKTQK
jgi:hypothetical protein